MRRNRSVLATFPVHVATPWFPLGAENESVKALSVNFLPSSKQPFYTSKRERKTWQLRLLHFFHFNWPVGTEATKELSKTCQK